MEIQVSVRFGNFSVSDFQLRWLHHTGIKTPFALRLSALALSVGCNGGAGWLAPVGWIGAGDFLLTPRIYPYIYLRTVTARSLGYTCVQYRVKHKVFGSVVFNIYIYIYISNWRQTHLHLHHGIDGVTIYSKPIISICPFNFISIVK